MSIGLLAGKVAVVTGSTQGLGAGIARLFVKEGAQVVLAGRSRKNGAALQKELGAATLYVPTDLGKVDDCKRLAAAALKQFGGVDVLVNSAALSTRATLESFTPELFDTLFHLNVRAPLLLAQSLLHSLQQRKGVIFNIGSINAYVGWPDLLVYAASKGALMTASRNLANALKYARVRVFCLNCGWIDTEGERAVMKSLGHDAGFLDRAAKTFPEGRIIQPEEVGEICLLLASKKASVFSGAVIDLEQFPIGTLHDPSADKDPTK